MGGKSGTMFENKWWKNHVEFMEFLKINVLK